MVCSLSFYQAELRPVLEHLLAARLAERHRVNLYDDREAAPAAAVPHVPGRRPVGVDRPGVEAAGPGRASTGRGASTERGIPRRTLTRLIDRLERL